MADVRTYGTVKKGLNNGLIPYTGLTRTQIAPRHIKLVTCFITDLSPIELRRKHLTTARVRGPIKQLYFPNKLMPHRYNSIRKIKQIQKVRKWVLFLLSATVIKKGIYCSKLIPVKTGHRTFFSNSHGITISNYIKTLNVEFTYSCFHSTHIRLA